MGFVVLPSMEIAGGSTSYAILQNLARGAICTADVWPLGNGGDPELQEMLMGPFSRPSSRRPDEMRRVSFEAGVLKHAEGSCLVKFGGTHVLCTASLENQAPPFLRGSG